MHQKLYKYIPCQYSPLAMQLPSVGNNESLEGFKNEVTHFSILQAAQYIRSLTYSLNNL